MARKKKKTDLKKLWPIGLIILTLIIVLIFSNKNDISRDNYRIAFNENKTEIYIGEEFKINYTVFHSTNMDNIVWSTTNSNIATVDAYGKVTGISFGNVTIKAELMNGNTEQINIRVLSYPVYLKVNTDLKPIKDWYNKELNITLDYLNIDEIKYCVVTKETCEPNITYKNKITLKNGIWNLFIKGTDKNNKEVLHGETFKIDLQNPNCEIKRLGKWTDLNTYIEVECNDLSGIDRYEWHRDNEKILTTTDNKINASDIYLIGKHKYSVKIYDLVSNSSTFSFN